MDMLPNDDRHSNPLVGTLLKRVLAAKAMTAELLHLITHTNPDNLKPDDIHERFSVLSAEMSSITRYMRGDPNSPSDGPPLRNLIVTPALLTMETDEHLAKSTDGRVTMFNHNVPADYLRTKPEDAVTANDRDVVNGMLAKAPDHITKQVNAFNKHIDGFLGSLREYNTATEYNHPRDKPTSSREDTHKVLMFMYRFDPPTQQQQLHQQQMLQQQQQRQMQMQQQGGYGGGHMQQ